MDPREALLKELQAKADECVGALHRAGDLWRECREMAGRLGGAEIWAKCEADLKRHLKELLP